MTENAVLDKGLILGYCFFSDPHHERCLEYIDFEETDYFTTRQIEEIYHRKHQDIIRTHRRAILDHARNVTDGYGGTLHEEDIQEIRAGIDRGNTPAWRYLLDFYRGRTGQDVYVVTKELRNLARDLEQRAEQRKEVLYAELQSWLRIDSHEAVQEQLEPLRQRDEEDFWVCIDAHDIAANIAGDTELATTDPKDFGAELVGSDSSHVEIETMDELILAVTALSNIEFVFVSRSYEPPHS